MKKTGIFLLTVLLICALFAGCRANVAVSPGIVTPPLRTTAPPENFGYYGNPDINHDRFGEGLLGTGPSVYDGVYNGEVLPGQTLGPYSTPNYGTGYTY